MESLGRRLRASIERSIDDAERRQLLVFLESLKLAIMDEIEAGETVLVYELPETVYDVRSPMHALNELWLDFEDWLRHNDLTSSLRADKDFGSCRYNLAVYPGRFGPVRKPAEDDLAETWLEKLRARPDATGGAAGPSAAPDAPEGA